MVEDGHFDAALYNQLSGLTIRVPSLADHAEDIPDIASTLLTQLVDANEVPLRTLTVGALNVMRNLDWPGNLPVLQNAVKTLALTALANEISGEDVSRVAREFNLGSAGTGNHRSGCVPGPAATRCARAVREAVLPASHPARGRQHVARRRPRRPRAHAPLPEAEAAGHPSLGQERGRRRR
jgi:DNA-binding NtrC family response regulator